MIRIKFIDWIHKLFDTIVKAYREQNSLPLKNILTLNITLVHPLVIQEDIPEQLDFIKMIFRPPKTTSLIQRKIS